MTERPAVLFYDRIEGEALPPLEECRQECPSTCAFRPKAAIVLELSLDQARLLMNVLDRVAGDIDGPRGEVTAIADALVDAGIDAFTEYRNGFGVYGEIYFTEQYPAPPAVFELN